MRFASKKLALSSLAPLKLACRSIDRSKEHKFRIEKSPDIL
jgi:hypothetical protein